jgi:hypothetical protein
MTMVVGRKERERREEIRRCKAKSTAHWQHDAAQSTTSFNRTTRFAVIDISNINQQLSLSLSLSLPLLQPF